MFGQRYGIRSNGGTMSLFKRDHQGEDIVPRGEFPFEELLGRFLRAPLGFENRLPEPFRRGPRALMNVGEDENAYHVSLELPGMSEEDIEIQIMGRQLVVSGERLWEKKSDEKDYHRVESQFGRFERSVTLPEGCRLEADSIDAIYDKGILELSVPKVEPTPSRRVPVRKK